MGSLFGFSAFCLLSQCHCNQLHRIVDVIVFRMWGEKKKYFGQNDIIIHMNGERYADAFELNDKNKNDILTETFGSVCKADTTNMAKVNERHDGMVPETFALRMKMQNHKNRTTHLQAIQ